MQFSIIFLPDEEFTAFNAIKICSFTIMQAVDLF